jgi:hypothetical protein
MGTLAMTGPVIVETVLAQWLATPYIRSLAAADGQPVRFKTQFLFTVPLSFGGVLLSIAGVMIGAFIAHAAEAARMLPIHYVTMGVVNPVGFAALRMQAWCWAFPPSDRATTRSSSSRWPQASCWRSFLWWGDTSVAKWYFGEIQNVPLATFLWRCAPCLQISVLPIIQSLRGHAEGLAAWRKRPIAILAGQAVNLASLVCASSPCSRWSSRAI